MAEPGLNLTLERLRRLPIRLGDEVWEVGVIDLPGMVQDHEDDVPWQPVCSACVSNKGGATMTPLFKPAELPSSTALDALARFALESHAPGAEPLGYLPERVAISSMPDEYRSHFLAAMRELDVEVEVKEILPDLQGFVEFLTECAEADGPIEAPSLLKAKDMTVARVRAFAEAAVLFHEAEPWMHFPSEVAWIIAPSPRTRALRTCVVMGAGGEEFGLAFLASALELQTMAVRAMLNSTPGQPRGTAWSMTFMPIADAPSRDAEMWIANELPLAAPNAFPLPIGVTKSGNIRRPTCEQLTLMEALLRGFAEIGADAYNRESIEFQVPTFDGTATLRLRCGTKLPSSIPPLIG